MPRFDILLKNGLVVDPANKIHSVLNVAVKDGLIAGIMDPSAPEDDARAVYDLSGKIVTPGMIDLHCHPASGFADLGVNEHAIGLSSGVTLLCDAGSAGSYNFDAFRRLVAEPACSDILCFLNLANTGLVHMPEIRGDFDIDIENSRKVIEANRDIIRGVKVRLTEAFFNGCGLKGVELAKALAAEAGLPLMVHIGETRQRQAEENIDIFVRSAVSFLEKDDIVSHFLTWEPGGLILKDGTVYPELLAAQKRGVALDACHGLNHFSLSVARQAIAQNILPTILSTDLCKVVVPSAQSLAVVMSKFLNLGVGLDQVVEMVTLNPAKVIKEDHRYGCLEAGRAADISVLELIEGDFIYTDGNGGETSRGKSLLEPRMTIKNGRPSPAFSNYHVAPAFT